MEPLQKRYIVEAPKPDEEFPGITQLRLSLPEANLLLVEVTAQSTPLSCMQTWRYPNALLLADIEDLSTISGNDFAVLDDWAMSETNSLIIYSHTINALPRHWMDIFQISIEAKLIEHHFAQMKRDYLKHIRIWRTTGLHYADEAERELIEFYARL